MFLGGSDFFPLYLKIIIATGGLNGGGFHDALLGGFDGGDGGNFGDAQRGGFDGGDFHDALPTTLPTLIHPHKLAHNSFLGATGGFHGFADNNNGFDDADHDFHDADNDILAHRGGFDGGEEVTNRHGHTGDIHHICGDIIPADIIIGIIPIGGVGIIGIIPATVGDIIIPLGMVGGIIRDMVPSMVGSIFLLAVGVADGIILPSIFRDRLVPSIIRGIIGSFAEYAADIRFSSRSAHRIAYINDICHSH